MALRCSFSAWLRSLLVAALVLAISALHQAETQPDWLAASICHPPSSDMSGQPSHATHAHCALCQLGPMAGMPPHIGAWPYWVSVAVSAQPDIPAARPRHFAFGAYASRAPPRLG